MILKLNVTFQMHTFNNKLQCILTPKACFFTFYATVTKQFHINHCADYNVCPTSVPSEAFMILVLKKALIVLQIRRGNRNNLGIISHVSL